MLHTYIKMQHLSKLLWYLRELEEFKVRAGIIKEESELQIISCCILNKGQQELEL